jgi:hypothetical protein
MSDHTDVTRRGVMKGIGGIAALSMSNATIAEAQDVLNNPLPTDPHTRDTYRAIVDAILPRTPHLDVELEKFLIWDFNHFQEVRQEQLTEKQAPEGPAMPASMFETELDLAGDGSALDALLDLADEGGIGGLGGLGSGLELTDGVEEHLDFGPVDRFEITFENLDTSSEGPASFRNTVVASDQPHQQVLENYPYAAAFTFAFDLVAAEFLAQAKNEDQPAPNEQFPGGGTFVRLSREDRLRCLWTIVDGGAVDQLDSLLSPMLPDVGILKYVVMACNGLHGFGYYTEWSGYGDTKTAMPSDRELQVEADEVQSRQQTGYPGPKNGYAADWRHAIDGGFNDHWEPVDGPGKGKGVSNNNRQSTGVSGDPRDAVEDALEGDSL